MKPNVQMRPPQRKTVEPLIRQIEQRLQQILSPIDGAPRLLGEAMRYCVLSGGKGRRTNAQRPKRFRPLLCLGGCEAVGGTLRRALPVACAIELIHSYSLVHDDLPAMDNADERRGRPSCHRRFGEATAILVGDALLTKAFELLSANGVANARAILRTVGEAAGTSGLIGGQVLDLAISNQQSAISIKGLEEVAKRKTAALMTASVMAGGLAGEALSQDLTRLKTYGLRLGLAFQLMDDLHDQDGFVRAMGPEAVRRKAKALIDQAKRSLDPFGQQAGVLLELADWLAHS